MLLANCSLPLDCRRGKLQGGILAWPAERMAHALVPKTRPRRLRRSRAPKELAGAAMTGTLVAATAERARAWTTVAASESLPDACHLCSFLKL